MLLLCLVDSQKKITKYNRYLVPTKRIIYETE